MNGIKEDFLGVRGIRIYDRYHGLHSHLLKEGSIWGRYGDAEPMTWSIKPCHTTHLPMSATYLFVLSFPTRRSKLSTSCPNSLTTFFSLSEYKRHWKGDGYSWSFKHVVKRCWLEKTLLQTDLF